ncbi:hypothetical protein BCR44DRAFT_1260203 [Catenaria anguillulae PL171]|uniref:Uncharacterized protein n=1 Tax=Catenaria anguillulae PL171 TaxID=765915 RepID=A0A1Y2HAW5_9FUNG|nr:hypothetical protein BCR44DRAFT_1260203 [Catenaria anguillulae PL171]
MSGESLRRQRAAASHRTTSLPMTPSPLPPPVFTSAPTASSLAMPELPRGPPPADTPGCHADRKSVSVALKNGQRVEMVLAESWDEVDLHIDWLLEDALIADPGSGSSDQQTQIEDEASGQGEQLVESFDDIVNDLPAATADLDTDAQQQKQEQDQVVVNQEVPLAANGQEMPPELDAEADFANQLNSDEGPGDTDSTSAAGTEIDIGADSESTTSTSRPSTALQSQSTTEFTYLVGLDTESYHIRAENRLLPTPTRTLPSTLQLASRTRVLIVPVYFLTHMQRQPLSARFRALFARNDVQWTGVGVLEDLVPFQASLGVAMHARGVLDVARVTKYWRVPMSLEDLTFQFTDLAGGAASHDRNADGNNDKELGQKPPVQVFGGVLHDVPPTVPSPTILRNLRTNAAACAQCTALVADPEAVPDYMYLEESLVGLGTGPEYPDLSIGWKSTQLSMSMWDMPPEQWTATHVVYAGMDAVASRAVGDKIRAVVQVDTWTRYWAALDAWKATSDNEDQVPVGPMPVLESYRPLPLRLAVKVSETHSPLEAIRRTLAHVAACREAGHPSIRSVLRCIQDWRLLRGVKDRRTVITRAIEHFVRADIVDLIDAQGNSLVGQGAKRAKFTFEAAALTNDAKVYLGHVCLTKPIDPVPPTSGVMGAIPDDLPAFLDANLGRIPGVYITKEHLVECVAWTHPELAVYNEQPARVLARAWVSGLPESMVNKVVKEARYQTRVVERGMVEGGMGGGGGLSRKERDRERLSKGQKRIREQQRENARRREEEYLEAERVRLEKVRLEVEGLAAAVTGDALDQDSSTVDVQVRQDVSKASPAPDAFTNPEEQSSETANEEPAQENDKASVSDVADAEKPAADTETLPADTKQTSPTDSEVSKSESSKQMIGKSSRSTSRSRRSNNNRARTSPPAKFDNSKIEAFLHPHPPHHTAPVPPAGSHRMVAAYKAHLGPDAKVAEQVALEWSWNESKLADADVGADAGSEEQVQQAAANVPLLATPQDAQSGSEAMKGDEWEEAEVVNKSLLEATGEADVDLLDQFAKELDMLDAEAEGLGVGGGDNGGAGGNQGTMDSEAVDEWWATADVEDELDLDAMSTTKPGFAGAIVKPAPAVVQAPQREAITHHPYSLAPSSCLASRLGPKPSTSTSTSTRRSRQRVL